MLCVYKCRLLCVNTEVTVSGVCSWLIFCFVLLDVCFVLSREREPDRERERECKRERERNSSLSRERSLSREGEPDSERERERKRERKRKHIHSKSDSRQRHDKDEMEEEPEPTLVERGGAMLDTAAKFVNKHTARPEQPDNMEQLRTRTKQHVFREFVSITAQSHEANTVTSYEVVRRLDMLPDEMDYASWHTKKVAFCAAMLTVCHVTMAGVLTEFSAEKTHKTAVAVIEHYMLLWDVDSFREGLVISRHATCAEHSVVRAARRQGITQIG